MEFRKLDLVGLLWEASLFFYPPYPSPNLSLNILQRKARRGTHQTEEIIQTFVLAYSTLATLLFYDAAWSELLLGFISSPMIDLDFLGVYNCHKNLVWHARSQPSSKFCSNTSPYCKKVVCPSSRSWEQGGTEQEFHCTRKILSLGGRSYFVLQEESILSALKNSTVCQSRLEHIAASEVTSHFTLGILFHLSVSENASFAQRGY